MGNEQSQNTARKDLTLPSLMDKKISVEKIINSSSVLVNKQHGTYFKVVEEDGKSYLVMATKDELKIGAVRGLYCPFKYGKPANAKNDIGWVDIPYVPFGELPRFVFTPGMNGCALYAVKKKNDRNNFRLYHVQNPGINQDIFQCIRDDDEYDGDLSTLTWEEYGKNIDTPFYVSLTFLYYHIPSGSTTGYWYYVSQFLAAETFKQAKITSNIDMDKYIANNTLKRVVESYDLILSSQEGKKLVFDGWKKQVPP